MSRDFVILGSDPEPNPRTCAARADEQLIAQGWMRRHSVDADRAKESIQLYESLGFEVLTRELTLADYDPGCRDCIANAHCLHVLIYTRKSAEGKLQRHEQSTGNE